MLFQKGGIIVTTLLDARTSQNASFANSISIPITAINAPQLFAQLTLSLAGATGLVRAQFTGVIALQLSLVPVATTATITVVRGTTLSDLIIFSEAQNLSTTLAGPQVVAFSGSDFNVPIAGTVVYTVFVSVSALGTTRVGPESFNAQVFSG
jgi:hypothetical protein